MQDYYTLEYSPTQKCFHHDTISGMIKHNLSLCLRGGIDPPGYICLGVFETVEERQVISDHLRKSFTVKDLGSDMITEKDYLETKIKLLGERKRLMNAEFDFKLKRLNEALDLQKGFEVSGKYGFRYEQF